jgi:hypothetical protein
MNRSIVFAGMVLAGMLATVAAHAVEPAAAYDPGAACREVAFKEYARSNVGPPGKYVEMVKVTKRTRLVCDQASASEKPQRAAAIVRHYKAV